MTKRCRLTARASLAAAGRYPPRWSHVEGGVKPAWLGTDVRAQNGIIRPGFETFLDDFAQRLQHDAGLRARLNHWLAERASSITEQYKHEVAASVAAQVKSWDTQHAVRTIELSIGRDLQYIRVNGALVGGLLGLAIFTGTRRALS
jgi:uncharacterized membrane-anchored protein YjiN (DUF445 family)